MRLRLRHFGRNNCIPSAEPSQPTKRSRRPMHCTLHNSRRKIPPPQYRAIPRQEKPQRDPEPSPPAPPAREPASAERPAASPAAAAAQACPAESVSRCPQEGPSPAPLKGLAGKPHLRPSRAGPRRRSPHDALVPENSAASGTFPTCPRSYLAFLVLASPWQ
ncbi:translation initiation factor IF-2-like [Penaeus chinensis]|uniref:translation initiation factor IF-2-like n=1 Tax=Penaeus chinensis TaxID=139456 RepID=UPI001FB585D2|nr:translation initiation factor IF-2-like [Penaeus chinensis]